MCIHFRRGIFPISVLEQGIIPVSVVVFPLLELMFHTFFFIYQGITPGKTLKCSNVYHIISVLYPCLTCQH